MELGGVTEVAIALGMSKQRVAAIRARPTFPQPEAQLAQGPVWDLEKIRRWADTSRQPRGRPHTLATRRRLANRYELDGLPDPEHSVNRATDLVALAAGRRCAAVAVHLVSRPCSHDGIESITAKLNLLAASPHPHVTLIIDHGVERDVQPYFVTPLPFRRLSHVLADTEGEDVAAVEILRQVLQGALHLVRLGAGVGFSIDSSTLVQGRSSAWAVGDIRPDSEVPGTGQLISQIGVLVRDIASSSASQRDGLVERSFQWLDTRLSKRSRSLQPEKLILLMLEDLEQVSQLLLHRSVPKAVDAVPGWVLDVIHHGVSDPDLLSRALAPLASTNRTPVEDRDWTMPLSEARRILSTLSPTQIAAVWHSDADLLRKAVATWASDLSDWDDHGGDPRAAMDFLVRLTEFDDEPLFLSSVLGMIAVAGRFHDWHSRSELIALLQNAREPQKIAIVIEALSFCDPAELRKALAGADTQWFTPKIREIVERMVTGSPFVIDLTRVAAPQPHQRAAGI
jgi:hypothetical protein